MAESTIRRPRGLLNPRADLSADEARAILSYDPKTGILRWKLDRHRIKAGQLALHKRAGRPSIAYCGGIYQPARVVWLIMTGEWPEHFVDHEDGDAWNLKWVNLRAATLSQNSVNRSYRSNQPYRGVFRIVFGRASGKRWRARITVNKKRLELGCFGSAEEAYEAYKQAALKYHGKFARLT